MPEEALRAIDWTNLGVAGVLVLVLGAVLLRIVHVLLTAFTRTINGTSEQFQSLQEEGRRTHSDIITLQKEIAVDLARCAATLDKMNKRLDRCEESKK
jgi:hypothetical protein